MFVCVGDTRVCDAHVCVCVRVQSSVYQGNEREPAGTLSTTNCYIVEQEKKEEEERNVCLFIDLNLTSVCRS